MADNPVLNRVSGFAAQPMTRQISLLAGFAASIALAVGLVNWASTPSYEPVYGAMAPADTAKAIDVLQTSGITYRIEQGTGLLEVPYDDVLQARMALASEGFEERVALSLSRFMMNSKWGCQASWSKPGTIALWRQNLQELFLLWIRFLAPAYIWLSQSSQLLFAEATSQRHR